LASGPANVKLPVAPAIVQDALDHATGSGFIKETATGPLPALKRGERRHSALAVQTRLVTGTDACSGVPLSIPRAPRLSERTR